MKDLIYVCVQPVDKYFIWQVHLWLESLKEIEQSYKAHILVYVPHNRSKEIKNWDNLVALYPESTFFFCEDKNNEIGNLLGIYLPVLRPHVLSKYFELHPELSKKAVFYCDSDILFLKNFNISKCIDDDVCYLSDTNSYVNASYFDSKVKDVLPEKLEIYKKFDILGELTKMVGVSREIAEKYNDHSGGAQYLLKNVDSDFWKKVKKDCILIRQTLQSMNRRFFENESKGYQSWCSDMFSVLWNLWYFKKETKVIPELDFAWSTDHINELPTVSILHNAGVTSPIHTRTENDTQIEIPMFYKGKYHLGSSPFDDVSLEETLKNEENQKLCNNYYLNKLLELKFKYYGKQ